VFVQSAGLGQAPDESTARAFLNYVHFRKIEIEDVALRVKLWQLAHKYEVTSLALELEDWLVDQLPRNKFTHVRDIWF
jgi:hypothetical protein